MPRDYFGEGAQVAFNMFGEAAVMAFVMTAVTEAVKWVLGPQEALVFLLVMLIVSASETSDAMRRTMRRMKRWPTQRLIGFIVADALILLLMIRAIGSPVAKGLIATFLFYLGYAALIVIKRLVT